MSKANLTHEELLASANAHLTHKATFVEHIQVEFDAEREQERKAKILAHKIEVRKQIEAGPMFLALKKAGLK